MTRTLARSSPWAIALLLIGISPVHADALDPSAGLVLQIAPLAKAVGRPPEPGSDALKRDLSVLRWLQFTRNPRGVAQAWSFLNLAPAEFEPAVGSVFGKTAPQIQSGLPFFVKRVQQVKDLLKEEIARPRPYVAHPDLQPCLPKEVSKSYPSGHATWYVTTSLLLADLLPQRRERLLAVGRQGMAARVTCSIHYPSDVEAGQRLAQAAVAQILGSPQWQSFKASVQPEVNALLTPPVAGLPELFD